VLNNFENRQVFNTFINNFLITTNNYFNLIKLKHNVPKLIGVFEYLAEETSVQLSDSNSFIKPLYLYLYSIPIYPSDPNKIVQLNFNQNEIITLKKTID
jgi:hypothetical protein